MRNERKLRIPSSWHCDMWRWYAAAHGLRSLQSRTHGFDGVRSLPLCDICSLTEDMGAFRRCSRTIDMKKVRHFLLSVPQGWRFADGNSARELCMKKGECAVIKVTREELKQIAF